MKMNTQQLVETLSKVVPRVAPHALERRIGIGITAGGFVTTVLVAAVLGVRPDLRAAMHGFSFWMKWAYTISLGIGAVHTVAQLARPTAGSLRRPWVLLIPVLILMGIGIGELARTPSANWLPMWRGQSWMICPWLGLTPAAALFFGCV